MDKLNKKYLIVGIITTLVIFIGLSVAYFSAQVEGKGKNIVIQSDVLRIVFTDTTKIADGEVSPGWSVSKEFSVENQSDDVYYYNIGIENITNTFVTDSLQYIITGDGFNMTEPAPVPKQEEVVDGKVTLEEGIEIEAGETQNYKIKFTYEDNDEDQSDDMGKIWKRKW